MKRFEVAIFLSGRAAKFIQMPLQIEISMYFQVVISMHFQVVLSSSNNVTTCSSHARMYFHVYVLTTSYMFNGNGVGALHKKKIENYITYYSHDSAMKFMHTLCT